MKLYWHGKEVNHKEFIDKCRNVTKKDLLTCQKCMTKFKQSGPHEWKPVCKCYPDAIIGVG